MIKKIKIILVGLAAFSLMAVPVTAFASNITGALACGTNLSSSTTGCTIGSTSATGKVSVLISDVINVFSWLVGGISVIMIIYGGFRYVTSGGNDAGVSGAKNTIIYALIGLVIVALAQIIVHFVLAKAISVNNSTIYGGLAHAANLFR